jgi:uncharacterized protein (TIGR02118 family)
MIKLVSLMCRKPGLSMEEFARYYEESHVPLIRELLPFMHDYRRNFVNEIQPPMVSHGQPGREDARTFDVMTEIWFQNLEQYQRMRDALADPAIGQRIADDEANLFDRSTMSSWIVNERRSD